MARPMSQKIAIFKAWLKHGLEKWGHHGQVSAMGVSMTELPSWDNINLVTAQLARRPLLDDDPSWHGKLVNWALKPKNRYV